jgi:hypothetical protein
MKQRFNLHQAKLHFLTQYVLNRAATKEASLDGKLAAEDAVKAWEVIEKEIKK